MMTPEDHARALERIAECKNNAAVFLKIAEDARVDGKVMKVVHNRFDEINSAVSEKTPEGLEKAKFFLEAMVEEMTAITSGTDSESFTKQQIVLIKQEVNLIIKTAQR